MTKNDSNYGDSQFRQFPTFGESGISVTHSTEVGRNARPSGTHKAPGMKPMTNMTYQPPAKTKMIGNRPVGNRQVPSTGVSDNEYNYVLDELGADETDPISGQERHTAELFMRNEFGESQSNVF